MNEENKNKDLQNVSDEEIKAELEKRTEKKCGDWGRNIEKKFDNFESKVPKPINSFFDALCLSVIIAGLAWLFTKFKWISGMPSWLTFGIIFCIIFLISLIYRLIIKPKRKQ